MKNEFLHIWKSASAHLIVHTTYTLLCLTQDTILTEICLTSIIIYRVSHLRISFLKGFEMTANQYVDKKIRQLQNHKASPIDLQPSE